MNMDAPTDNRTIMYGQTTGCTAYEGGRQRSAVQYLIIAADVPQGGPPTYGTMSAIMLGRVAKVRVEGGAPR